MLLMQERFGIFQLSITKLPGVADIIFSKLHFHNLTLASWLAGLVRGGASSLSLSLSFVLLLPPDRWWISGAPKGDVLPLQSTMSPLMKIAQRISTVTRG